LFSKPAEWPCAVQTGAIRKGAGRIPAGATRPTQNASIQNLLGVTETRLGRIDEANRYYRQAIYLDAILPGPHKNLGVNYLSSHQYGLAEIEFKGDGGTDAATPPQTARSSLGGAEGAIRRLSSGARAVDP
jgi:tetratricopeptide (TPR) repeat protein